MGTVVQDVRYGLRLLFKHRAFSVIAILTMALGIGVSTTLFSVIDAAFLRPLPYSHPEQLVEVHINETRDGMSTRYAPSLADIRAWRGAGNVFAHIGAGRVSGFLPRIVDAGEPERLIVGDVSEDFLEIYDVKPVLGRPIVLPDVREGAPGIVLLGHAYWQTRYGGNSNVIGRTIRIAGVPVTIVGILPAGFYRETAAWQPTRVSADQVNLRGSGTPVRGRLRPGVTLTQAEQELTALARATPAGPGQSSDVRVELTSLYSETTAGSRKAITPLAYAVLLVFLIACVNVAGLLLARGLIRGPELATRASIGATRARLVRQLLTESLVLSCAGGLVGVFFAWVSLDAVVAIIPMDLPSNSRVSISIPVLAFTTILSVFSSLVFGLFPAIRLSRVQMGAQLAIAGHRHGSALSRRAGQLLVASELALAVVLLAAAGLMIRSFARLTSVDVGFDPHAVVTMEVEPVDPTPAVLRQYYPAVLNAIRRLPEVVASGAVDYVPLRDGSTVTFVKGAGQLNLNLRQILPGYFEAMGLPVKFGRLPTESDRTGAEHVILLNEEAARLLFPSGDPLGRFVGILGDSSPHRVIGIVGNVRHYGPMSSPVPEAYLLYGQGSASTPLRMVLRPRSFAALSADRLRQAAQSVGPKVLFGPIRSSAEDLGESVATPRRRMLLLSLLGGFGMVLALVGVFGTTAYAVAQRTQEIGVRIAFGARPADVVLTTLRHAVWPTLLGLFAGMVGALYTARIIAAFLFETTSHDPLTFGAVAALVITASLIAACIPARWAARVDPVIVLRAE